jgi:hypothetical protein
MAAMITTGFKWADQNRDAPLVSAPADQLTCWRTRFSVKAMSVRSRRQRDLRVEAVLTNAQRAIQNRIEREACTRRAFGPVNDDRGDARRSSSFDEDADMSDDEEARFLDDFFVKMDSALAASPSRHKRKAEEPIRTQEDEDEELELSVSFNKRLRASA